MENMRQGDYIQTLFCFLKKFCIRYKFQYFSIALNLAYNKKKLHKTLDCWSRDMQAHLVGRVACNTRVIVDVSSNPPASNDKLL